MTTRVATLAAVGLVAALGTVPYGHHGLNTVLTAQIQAPATHDHDQTAPPAQTPGANQDRQKMMAAMKAADERLQVLVQKMNAANGQEKVNAMAELLTAIVQEHGAMRGGMMQGMADCPMMTDMSSMMNMMMNMKNR